MSICSALRQGGRHLPAGIPADGGRSRRDTKSLCHFAKEVYGESAHSIRDLKVHFKRRRQLVQAVDGVSLDIQREKPSGWWVNRVAGRRRWDGRF